MRDGGPASRRAGSRRGLRDRQRRAGRGAAVRRRRRHWLEYFRAYFGPIIMAFERVGEDGAAALEADLLESVRTHNRAGDEALVLPGGYVDVIATKA